jgi:hypothetical protein
VSAAPAGDTTDARERASRTGAMRIIGGLSGPERPRA